MIKNMAGPKSLASQLAPRSSQRTSSGQVQGNWQGKKETVPFQHLVIAGGGAGAYNGGGGGAGGGGAGGYRNSVPGETSGGNSSSEPLLEFVKGELYVITVGGGGARAADCDNIGGRGQNSSIVGEDVSIVSLGGGGGGYANVRTSTTAGEVGSGGGLAGYCCGALTTIAPGTPGQGTNGGMQFSSSQGGGGGGGGAGTSGGTGGSAVGGAGGNGLASSISGSSTTRAGGGGGAVYWFGNPGAGTRGAGGSGGGGYGGRQEENGSDGSAFTGSGGGGAGNDAQPCGSSGGGGSGIVIVRWLNTLPVAISTSGGVTYQNVGGYHTYTFTGTGTIRP